MWLVSVDIEYKWCEMKSKNRLMQNVLIGFHILVARAYHSHILLRKHRIYGQIGREAPFWPSSKFLC